MYYIFCKNLKLENKTVCVFKYIFRLNKKYFLMHLAFSSFLTGQIIPVGSFDPLVDLVELDFRNDFSLSQYRVIKEEGAYTLSSHVKNIDSSSISFRLNPNYYINNHDNYENFIISGFLNFKSKNLNVFIEPRLVSNKRSKDLLGIEYDRYALVGRIFNAYLNYKIDNFIFSIGRRPIWWGESWSSSIIQSSYQIPYDNILILYKSKNYSYEILNGQLKIIF